MQKMILPIALFLSTISFSMQKNGAIYHQNNSTKKNICYVVPSCCLPEKLAPEATHLYLEYKTQCEPTLHSCNILCCKTADQEKYLQAELSLKDLSLQDLTVKMEQDTNFKKCLISTTCVAGCCTAITAISIIGLLTTLSVSLLA